MKKILAIMSVIVVIIGGISESDRVFIACIVTWNACVTGSLLYAILEKLENK
jgi:hypothetical protein